MHGVETVEVGARIEVIDGLSVQADRGDDDDRPQKRQEGAVTWLSPTAIYFVWHGWAVPSALPGRKRKEHNA